jgi:hypothetical protein
MGKVDLLIYGHLLPYYLDNDIELSQTSRYMQYQDSILNNKLGLCLNYLKKIYQLWWFSVGQGLF